MKTSLPLKLCKTLICLLIISIIGSIALSMIDIGITPDLSEDEKNELMQTNAFRKSVMSLTELKDSKAVEIDDVIYIEYQYFTKSTDLYTSYETVIHIGLFESQNDIYFEISRDLKEISKNEYNELRSEYRLKDDTVFNGKELKFIKETAQSEDVDSILREWWKEQFESYKYVLKAIPTSDYLCYISEISVAFKKKSISMPNDIFVIQIRYGSNDSATQYFSSINGDPAHIATITEDMYISYKNSSAMTKETYYKKDIDILFIN